MRYYLPDSYMAVNSALTSELIIFVKGMALVEADQDAGSSLSLNNPSSEGKQTDQVEAKGPGSNISSSSACSRLKSSHRNRTSAFPMHHGALLSAVSYSRSKVCYF